MDRKAFKKLFESFNKKNVLIIGDVMLDAYWWGSVNRISPEAPVPIVAVKNKEYRLGGAANVALNLRKLGANPVLVSVIGDDQEGKEFLNLLEREGIDGKYLQVSQQRPTTVKTRVIGNRHQLLRVDSEKVEELPRRQTGRLWKSVEVLIDNTDVIIFEDYDKGILTRGMIKKVIERAKESGIPTVVDPKRRNFLSFKGATLFKPNLKEFQSGLNIDLNKKPSKEELKEASETLFNKLGIEISFITLSDRGVFVSDRLESHLIPAHVRSVSDVSGAGDTVVAVASLALSSELELPLIAEIANLAGGLVCEKVGVAPVEKDLLLEECLKHLIPHK